MRGPDPSLCTHQTSHHTWTKSADKCPTFEANSNSSSRSSFGVNSYPNAKTHSNKCDMLP